MPKCCICKKDLKKEEAYMFIHESKSGKQYKKYACSKEEVENDKRNKELYKQIQFITDEILGYPCVNNTRNKKIQELQQAKYSNEQIYRCFKEYKEEIIKWIEINEIDKEFNKICYMFAVISANIKDFSESDIEVWDNYKPIETEEVEVDIEEVEVPVDMKIKKRKKLF